MNVRSLTTSVLALAALAGLAACGGGKSAQTTQAAATMAASPMAAATAGSTMGTGRGASMGTMAMIPASLDCGTKKPVWVNPRSKVYHVSGDRYYGRTHNGKYLCRADAIAQGYHAAGHRRDHGKMHNSKHSRN